MPAPYITCGKQVLHTVDGLRADFAQAASEAYAQAIADAMNIVAGPVIATPTWNGYDPAIHDGYIMGEVECSASDYTPTTTPQRARFKPGSIHCVRQENDEFACSCGVRWDASDGPEHP